MGLGASTWTNLYRHTVLAVGSVAVCLLSSCGGSGGGGGGGEGSSGGVESDVSSTRSAEGDLSLTLAWDESMENEDGSPLVDLVGYRVYDGQSSGNYDVVTDVGDTTEVTIEGIPAGTYYIAVAAYDSSGNESLLSTEIVATVP